jgi:predicted RNA-binding protein with PIN domain
VRWLIDGYNVIRREPDLRAREAESLEAGRRALLHLLARAHRDPRDEFTVVFDGARVAGGAPSQGRIRTIFSRPPHTADDELMRLARQWQSGAVVVSSDRRIQDAARRAGAAALTAEQFLEALGPGPKGLSARTEGLSAGTKGLSAGTEPRRSFFRPPSDQAGPEDPATKDPDTDPEPSREKRGNPRRLSKKARKARRALGRLRQP